MGEEIRKLSEKWKHWKYKNTAMLLLSISLFFYFAESPIIKNSVVFIGNFGYLGAFSAGIFFVSIFTVAPASVVLFFLADTLNPLGVALIAGLGSMTGDYLIFRYFKDRVFDELSPLLKNSGGKPIRKLFKTPYFAWIIPIAGALIIMSPLPDEIGLGLMGVSRIKVWQLLGLLYLLNAVGIFLVVIAARSF